MKRKRVVLFTVTLLIYAYSQLISGCAGRVPKELRDERSSTGPIYENIESEDFSLEEITVTSAKIETNLHKIPMHFCILIQDEIKRMNVQQISELQKIIPDLKPNDRGNGTCRLALYIDKRLQLITIRNPDLNYFSAVSDEPISVMIDGVPLPRSNDMERKFYDLDRVEMLKRP